MIINRLLHSSTLLCGLAALWLTSSQVAAQQGASSGPGATDAKITSVKFLELSGGPKKAKFRLAILGENLPTTETGTKIALDTKDPGKPVEKQAVTFVSPQEIDVAGEAPVGTVITAVKITVGDKTATSQEGLTVSIKSLPSEPELKEFGIKFDHQQSKEFPNLHSVVVTKESGDAGFDANPNHMRIELEPAGATDLRVVQSNEELLELHFVAAADYEPKNVLITVYNGSDLDRRRPIGIAKVVSATPANDTNAPKISKVGSIFVDRSDGIGRIKIYGKNFGIQDRLSFSVDDYLCNCHERLTLSGFRACGILGDDQGPKYLTPQERSGASDAKQRKRLQAVQATPSDARDDEKDSDYMIGGDKGGPKALKVRMDARRSFCKLRADEWEVYQNKLRSRIAVSINSRNPSIRVEKAEFMDANDEMIDIYFEFTRHFGYAWPFRLAGIDLTINKTINKTEQTVKAEEVSGEIDVKTSATFTLSQPIGQEVNPDLASQYTVLGQQEARDQLGQGIADNFYVVVLSVVNNGKKAITMPLASIQVEVEWLYGFNPLLTKGEDGGSVQKVRDFYMDGPATVAPIPLASVSAFFGAYQKYRGTRTKWFNMLEGATILATALIPYSGPALKDAELVLSGGFIPGLRHAWPDLSAQQLQNMTSLSWESSETLAAGDSITKYIYIQRKSPQFQDPVEPISNPPMRTEKQISNIMGVEVTGFEVSDTLAKTTAITKNFATPQQQPTAAPPANSKPPSL